MTTILLILMIILGVIASIIFFTKNIGENYPQIWKIVSVYIITLFLIEQFIIYLLNIDIMTLSKDFTIGIWFYNVPIESIVGYIVLPFLVMNIYYGYVKSN